MDPPIPIEAAVRFFIGDPKVVSLHDDRDDILSRHEARFRQLRNWA